MHQFVMVLVARFRMSVAEIVIAYTLVSPPTSPSNHPPPLATHPARSRCPSPEHPRPNTSLHAMTRSSEYFGSTQTCYVATRSARSSWGAACWRSRCLEKRPPRYASYIAACRTCSTYSRSDCFQESSNSSWRCSARSLPLQPHGLTSHLSAPPPICAPNRANDAVQALDWRIPWRPGNIKPTPTSSSAWQRTRSSRRPCRPHRYSCRGNRRRCEQHAR